MALKFQKLTRPTMRKLLTGNSVTEHGIRFERLADCDGKFTINIMVDGQRIHRTIGKESDGTTRSHAESFIEKVRNDARHERLALPKGRKVALSFRQAAEKYISHLKEEGGKNIKIKSRQLTLHLIPFFGDLPLSKISTFDLERYKKKRTESRAIRSNVLGRGYTYKDAGATKGTINRELAVISHMFNKAIEWGWINHRPAKINRYKEDGGRHTYLTPEQCSRLVDAAIASSNPHLYPFIVIALDTSMRLMEVLSIRKEHVNIEARSIHVPKAKGGMREQPITGKLAKFLKEHISSLPDDTPWLFPSDSSSSGHVVNIRKPFRLAVKEAGLDENDVVRHTLRHTVITNLIHAGVDLPTVKRISGHKTLIMVERYAHANGAHIKEAMDKLEARMEMNRR